VVIANQPAVGEPSKELVAFEHDYIGLMDEERDGQHYRDSKWADLFPGLDTSNEKPNGYCFTYQACIQITGEWSDFRVMILDGWA
jgi:hypothetical protein